MTLSVYETPVQFDWDARAGRLASDSAAKIALLPSYSWGGVSNYFFTTTIPVIEATEALPLRPLTFWSGGYGPGQLDGGATLVGGRWVSNVKFPAGAKVGAVDDHHLVIRNQETKREHALWGASPDGNISQIGGGGSYPMDAYYRPGPFPNSSQGILAAWPLRMGVVTPDDITRGYINHALMFSIYAPHGLSVFPASSGDMRNITTQSGSWDRPTHLAVGQWVRLRAGADISGLSPFETMFATALKRYGAFLRDEGYSFCFYGIDACNQGVNETIWHNLGIDLTMVSNNTGRLYGLRFSQKLCDMIHNDLEVLDPPTGDPPSVSGGVVVVPVDYIGTKTVGGTLGSVLPADSKRATRFLLENPITINKIYWRLLGGASSQVAKALVYADNAGLPGALLKESDPVTIAVNQAESWVPFSLSTNLDLAIGTYHLGIIGGPTGGNIKGRYDVAGQTAFVSDTYADGASNPFDTSGGGGTSNIGKQSAAGATDSPIGGDYPFGNPYDLPAGTVTSVKYWLSNPGASPQDVRVALYPTTNGDPAGKAPIATSTPVTVPAGSAAAWYTFNFNQVVTAGKYVAALWAGWPTQMIHAWKLATVGVTNYWGYIVYSATNPPTTWGGGGTTINTEYIAYVTMTTGGVSTLGTEGFTWSVYATKVTGGGGSHPNTGTLGAVGNLSTGFESKPLGTVDDDDIYTGATRLGAMRKSATYPPV